MLGIADSLHSTIVPALTLDQTLPRVSISTPFGDFTVVLDTVRAPISASNFLAHVDADLFENTAVYRIVTNDNQPDGSVPRIEVVQFGFPPVGETYPAPLPTIAHETTAATGLSHKDGTLSMARYAPGTASSGFFICVGDQPELDFGGKRQPDGQGFAAFGWVESGMDVVRALHQQGESNQMIATPIPLSDIKRV